MDFEGGFVFSNPGYYEWVVSFDFASLYPSIIRAFNLCSSTYIKESDIPMELKQLRAKYIKSDTEGGILDQINLPADAKQELGDALKKYNMTVSPSGHFFDVSKEGISSYMMGKIYADRKVAKKKMLEAEKMLYETEFSDELEKDKCKSTVTRYKNQQQALKIALNSFFGACGNAHFILTKKAVAESITSAGRLYDRSVQVLLDFELNKRYEYDRDPCIQADTDSCYFYLKPIVENSGLTIRNEILEYVDKKIVPIFDKMIKTKVLDDIASYRNLLNPSVMDMEREVIADVSFNVGKKNYTMNILDSEGTRFEHGKKKIIGLNIKKTNLPAFVRKKMLVFLDLLFDGKEKLFQEEIAKFKDEFTSLPVSDISFPKGVNLFSDKTPKGIKIGKDGRNEYTLGTSGCPIHVRASLLYNDYLEQHGLLSKYDKIEDGSKMKFIYLKVPNPVWNQNVIGFPNDRKHTNFIEESGLLDYVDHKMLFEGLVHKSLEPLIELINWSFEKKIRLTDFF
jgi:DNA polymerase elongation subunit (family B)